MSIYGNPPIPFRRLTDPLWVPVGPTAQRFDIPEGFIPKEANAFWIVNANLFWIRLKGSGDARNGSGSYIAVEDSPTANSGWLWKPGYSDVFTTQFPMFLSTISVSRQGISAGTGFMEIAWGIGG